MFLKLMKQDIRATARIMVPVYAAAIVLAVFTRVLDLLPQDNAFMSVLAGLVGVLFSLAMSATVVASFVLMIWRFHKNYMTDEGYLMFTLPVSTAELIFSKLLVAIAWFACSALVVSIATLIVGSGGHISFVGFDSIPAEELRSVSAAVVTATLVAGVTFCLMLYACMAIGQSFRRRKTLMAVVFFFVFYIISQIVGVQLIANAVQNSPPAEAIFTGSSVEMIQFIRGVLWRSSAISAVGAVVFYAITHWMLAKRLNLQ